MTLRIRIPAPIKPADAEPKMHKAHCRLCPSQPGAELDPECADIVKLPHANRLETAFPCGWAPSRYCKGYCDTMGITNQDLEQLHETRT